MNVVIYESDLNPLTIIELPQFALEAGARMGIVNLPFSGPVKPYQPEDMGHTLTVTQFALEFKRLRFDQAEGYCIIARDKALKAWLMPPYGKARTPQEFLRNRDELARSLRQVLAHGVGGR